MRILLSNDDGVFAKGLSILAQTLSEIGEIVVVAPDRNRSGASNSLTLSRPLRVRQEETGFYSVDGTPTDCVHISTTGFFEHNFDIVVSGVNAGANLGDDVLYSGTVAAASEGRFLGLPSIAVSLVSENFKYYETAAKVAKRMVKHIKKVSLPSDTILNVNVPDMPFEQLNGYEITRLGTRHSAEPTIRELDPRGNTVYWVGPAGSEEDAGPGTDFYALKAGKVSITPIRLEPTDFTCFEQLSVWKQLFE